MFLIQRKKEGKPVSESAVTDQKIEVPSIDISPHGIIFGGKLLQVVSKYATLVANDHSGGICDTIGIDFVRFFSSAKRGDMLFCKCSVNNAWESVLEVGVSVIAEDIRLLEQRKVLSAYFTFSAIDDLGCQVEIAGAIPETHDEKRRYTSAEKRKQLRKKNSSNPFYLNP
jgi:acyl-CoA hydrolase